MIQKWLANFLSNRTAAVNYKIHKIKNDDFILSPSTIQLVNIQPPPSPTDNENILINTYANYIIITFQSDSISRDATPNMQNYIELLLQNDRMTASAEKPAITLLTTDKHQSHTPKIKAKFLHTTTQKTKY